MQTTRDSRWRLPLLMPLLCWAGCAGEEPAPPPAPAGAAKAPPAPSIVQQAPNNPQPAARQNAKPAPVANRPLPPGVDLDNVFLAMPADRGNFTIVENSDGTVAGDWFVAALPAAGSDASSFFVIPPEGAGERGSQRPAARLPEGFVAVEAAGTTDDGWPRRIRCEIDGAEMAFVPGSVFLFGFEGVSESALPAHPVELDPYYIDVTEVTLDRYREFIEASREKRRPIPAPANADAPGDHPVLGVEWGEAVDYAEWAEKALPTEAEWELAARGPDSFLCPWGNGRAVWDGHRETGQIDAAGTFSTDHSVFGVLDMAGNAKEWVWDLYGAPETNPARTPGGAAVKNPAGPRRPSIPNHRVVKGGGPSWELWHRTSASMSAPTPDLGFRCVVRVLREGGKIVVRTLDGDHSDKGEDASPSGRSRPRNPRNPAPGR